MPVKSLTLKNAREKNQLADFVSQQEAWEAEHGFDGANRKELEEALARPLRSTQSEDRTSRSSDGDGLTET